MFPGLVTDARRPIIEAGLPALNAEMEKAGITTPRRKAAFLTTLRHESWILYNQRQLTQTRKYYGRGLIQLTGRATDPDPNGVVMNYTAAGKHLGIDLVGNPDLALDIRYSAKIAVWYWTTHDCNTKADHLDMGAINAAIGYPRSPDGSNDNARCLTFQKALQYLTGELLPVDCTR